MKKLLSLLLAICLCAVCFVGCNESTDDGKKTDGGKNALKLEDVQKDPYQAIQNAGADATDWLADDAGIASIIKDALKNGSVELLLESESLFSMMEIEGLESIKGTVYSDVENKKGALEVVVGMGGEELSGILYVTENGLMINSAALLNTENTYMIDLSTLLDEELFAASLLPVLFEIPEEELAEILPMLGVADTVLGELSALDWSVLATQVVAAMQDSLNLGVSAGSFKDAAGKTVSCAVISYTMDADTIKAMCLAAIDAITIPDTLLTLITGGVEMTEAEVKEGLKQAFSEGFDAGLEGAEIAPTTMKYYLSLKTGALVGMQTVSTIVDVEYDMTSTSTVTVYYNANGIVVEALQDMGGYKSGASLTIAKTDKNGVVTYEMSMDMVMDNMKQNAAKITASYTKANGALALALSVEGEPMIEIGGAVGKTDTVAAIEFNSLKLKNVEVQEGVTTDVTLDLNLSLTFTKGTAVPALPEDAKDLVTMTEEDWGEMMGAIENSLLGQIIAMIMSGNKEESQVQVRKPAYIPEGMVEEQYWINETGACYAYGYMVEEDGMSYVAPEYLFHLFADAEIYEEDKLSSLEWADGSGTTTIGGQTLFYVRNEFDGIYYYWSDEAGYYMLDAYDRNMDTNEIARIISSLQ